MNWAGGWIIQMMLEVMRYFGLYHRPLSQVKLKLKEPRSFYIEINSDYEMKLMYFVGDD